MRSKPSWGFWLVAALAYLFGDRLFVYVRHGSLTHDVTGGLESSLFGATVTWLFALYKWHKVDAGL